jgi:hypothetical protein
MAERLEDPGSDLDVGEEPPRQETDPAPLVSTVVALGLTILAALMTLPALVLCLVNPDWDSSWDWVASTWQASFPLGVIAMILALLSGRSERNRGSMRGRRLATVAVLVAVVGAIMWTWVLRFVAEAIEGG